MSVSGGGAAHVAQKGETGRQHRRRRHRGQDQAHAQSRGPGLVKLKINMNSIYERNVNTN